MALLRTQHWCARWATCRAPLAQSPVLSARMFHEPAISSVNLSEPVHTIAGSSTHPSAPTRRRHTTSKMTARTAGSSNVSFVDQHGSLINAEKTATSPQPGSSTNNSSASKQPAEKPLRVERLLANLGYGKRQECTAMIKRKRLVYSATGTPAKVSEKAFAADLLLDGEPLDPAPPLTIVLHKPVGCVVTSPDDENVTDPKVYDLLPYRFGRRRPFLSSIGRLDKQTSGLLLLTDDGALLHSIQSPVRGIWKVYVAELASPLEGREAAAAMRRFASGRLQLQGDRTPLLPAALTMTGPTTAEVAVCEGRYHQIRRMFAALGHHVVELHRRSIGGLRLSDTSKQQSETCGSSSSNDAGKQVALAEGEWRYATAEEIAAVLAGPDLQSSIEQQQAEQESDDSSAARPSQQQEWQPQQPGQQPAQTGRRQVHTTSNAVKHSSGGGRSETGEDVLPAIGLSSDDAAWYAAVSSSNSSSSAGGSAGNTCSDDVDEVDVDEVEEQLSAVKRYRDSSRWARRRAAVARGVQTLRRQHQQQYGARTDTPDLVQ